MIRAILCPVDLTELSQRTVRLAGELARRLEARVVLHHNVDAAPPSPLAVSWMWSEDHEQEAEGKVAEAAAGLRALFPELPGLEVEAKLTRGPLDGAVHQVARESKADLLVIATHGAARPARDSETEQMVLRAPCAVLALGESCGEIEAAGGEVPMPVVVATDFTRLSRKAVTYAFALAEELPLRLHLVHGLGAEHGEAKDAKAKTKAIERLKKLVPESFSEEVSFHAATGRPEQVILDAARQAGARFVLMAAHKKGPLRRAVFGTTTLAVLRSSSVPIWFLPEGFATGAEGSKLAALLQQAVE